MRFYVYIYSRVKKYYLHSLYVEAQISAAIVYKYFLISVYMTLDWGPITKGYSNYEGNHVMFPMLLVFLYQSAGEIKYLQAAFFAVTLAAVWEIIEIVVRSTFNSYILFGVDNESYETIVDIVVLDIGNGVIGAALGVLVLLALKPPFQKVNFWIKTTIFLLFGAVYSYLSSFGSCGDLDCKDLVIPWGNYANMGIVIVYSYFFLYRWVTDVSLTVAYASNAIIILIATSVRWKSTAITVYIASGVLLVVWCIVYLCQRDKRYSRLR